MLEVRRTIAQLYVAEAVGNAAYKKLLLVHSPRRRAPPAAVGVHGRQLCAGASEPALGSADQYRPTGLPNKTNADIP